MTEPLRILTWNTWLQSDPTSNPDPNPGKRAPLIAEKLRSSNRDILLLQKVWKCRTTLIDGLMSVFPHISGKINDGPGLNLHSGLLTVSRFPLFLLGSIDFEDGLGVEGSFSNKGAALWRGEWDGHPFQLASVHLQGHVDGDKKSERIPETRRSQLRQIRDELLDRHAEPSVPQIICGDFSIDRDTSDYHDMLAILDAENGTLIGEVLHTAYGRDKGEYPNDIGRDFIDWPEMLDYVLLRRNGCDPDAVTITCSVRRYIEPWTAFGGSTYRNLAYRYALKADIAFGMADGVEPPIEEDADTEPDRMTPLLIAADHLS